MADENYGPKITATRLRMDCRARQNLRSGIFTPDGLRSQSRQSLRSPGPVSQSRGEVASTACVRKWCIFHYCLVSIIFAVLTLGCEMPFSLLSFSPATTSRMLTNLSSSSKQPALPSTVQTKTLHGFSRDLVHLSGVNATPRVVRCGVNTESPIADQFAVSTSHVWGKRASGGLGLLQLWAVGFTGRVFGPCGWLC